MLDFLLLNNNLPYSIGLMIVLFFSLIEIAGMLIGFNLFSFVDDFSADTDLSSSGGTFTELFSWLGFKQVPFLIWLITFLGAFSFIGLLTNLLSAKILGTLLPNLITLPVSLFGSSVITGQATKVISFILPQDETSAISANSFEGQVAQITYGTASVSNPAEASLKDEHGQKHYVLVEPIEAADVIKQSEKVILVEKIESIWKVIPYRS